MDQVTSPLPRLLPTLAAEIAIWFPELDGRSVAVSEADITKENIPGLPLVMVAFAKSVSEHPINSTHFSVAITDTVVIEFWLEPSRYKRQNGTETPFWSYYDYESIRNILLTNLINWHGPNGERFAYRSMTIEAESLAVILTFTFLASFMWCADEPQIDQCVPSIDIDGKLITPSTFVYSMCAPVGKQCPPAFEEEDWENMEEAPDDGNAYVRMNKMWVRLDTAVTGLGAYVPEAPFDDKPYIRLNKQWEELQPVPITVDLDYQFNAATPPPTGSQMRLDNTDQKLATKIFLTHNTSTGEDPTNVLNSVKVDDHIYVQDVDNSTLWRRYNIIGVPINQGNYTEIPIAWMSGDSALAEQRVRVTIGYYYQLVS